MRKLFWFLILALIFDCVHVRGDIDQDYGKCENENSTGKIINSDFYVESEEVITPLVVDDHRTCYGEKNFIYYVKNVKVVEIMLFFGV